MSEPLIVDAGPLVAFLLKRERHHEWATERFAAVIEPLITCEAVISEAAFLLARTRAGAAPLMELLGRSIVTIPLRLSEHVKEVQKLMQRYADAPMSLADACLVRMSELHAHSAVLTLDRHFTIYRRHGRQVIPIVMPSDR